MEVTNTHAAAAEPRSSAVNHAMQKNRQAYLARLKSQTEHKMRTLREEAEYGVEGE